MASAATKRARAGGGLGGDRLSALPDELLHRVLSFLPSQEVVRTTVLSKRWTNLWRSVPCIDLNFIDFKRAPECCAEAWEKMKDFTNNLLMLHRAPCLDAFRLIALFQRHDEARHIDPWVRRAIKDNPLVLKVSAICITHVSYYQLPHLGSGPCRRLRRLQLTGMSLDRSFAECLHSWWPYLDDLNLNRCRLGFSCIDSDKLVNLGVTICCTNQPANALVIRAPRLASLELDIPFSLDAGNCLVRALISLEYYTFSPRIGAMLLGSLSSVTSFEFKGFQTMAVLDEEFDKVPTFDNLRTLSIESCFLDRSRGDVRKFKALGRFLQKSPNLERLTLKHFKVSRVVELVEYPKLECLRTLFLDCCDLHDNFGLLRHCLQSSPNLEKLTVHYCMLPKQLPDSTNGGGRNAKSKETYSGSRNLACSQCPKLKSTEIIYYQHDNVSELVRFLLEVAAPKNTITFSYPPT